MVVPDSPVSCNQCPRSPVTRVLDKGNDGLPCTLEREPTACLYSAMLRAENKVGGGEGLEGVYGSITRVGMTRILDAFQEHAQLNCHSVMLDIGSGLGRPLLHVALHSNVTQTYGIEVDAVKCQKAIPFLGHVAAELQSQGIELPVSSLPKIICAPIEQVPSLEPATHVYAAWEGFSRVAMEAVGQKFAASTTAKAITIVQRSFRQKDGAEEMEEMGFGRMKLVDSVAVNMAGSRRRLMAYCFVRDPMPTGAATATSINNLSTMPAFTPDSVGDVLSSQASERAAAKAATTGSSDPAHGQQAFATRSADNGIDDGCDNAAATAAVKILGAGGLKVKQEDSQQSDKSAVTGSLRRSQRTRS